jgi:hypothetical protein
MEVDLLSMQLLVRVGQLLDRLKFQQLKLQGYLLLVSQLTSVSPERLESSLTALAHRRTYWLPLPPVVWVTMQSN